MNALPLAGSHLMAGSALLLIGCGVLSAAPAPSGERIEYLIQRLNVSWDLAAQMDAKAAYDELRKTGREIVPACLDAMERGNASARMWAAAAAASTRDPRAVDPMLQLLRDDHYKVRMIATWHIHVFMQKDLRVAPALGAQLADTVIGVRQQAMKALGRMKPPAALPNIRAALRTDDLDARADALRMVLAYEGKELRTEIPRIMHGDGDGHLRSAAVAILPTAVTMNEARALEIVTLVNDPERLVSAASLRLLGEFFKKPPLSGIELRKVSEAAAGAITEAAGRKEPEVREAAMPLLGHLKRQKALAVLVRALQSDPDPRVRASSARGLLHTRVLDGRVLDPLLKAVKDKSPEVRSSCLKMLASLSKKDGLPPQSRSHIADQLASQSDAIFDDPVAAVRAAAYVALGELLKLRSSTALIHAIETDKNRQARMGAVMGLFLTGRRDSPAVLAVLEAMGDRNTAVGSTAVKVAKKLLSGAQPSPAITAQLRKLASDDDAAVRARSLPVLGMYAREAALDVIASTIQADPVASVRKAAIDALARSRIRSAVAVDAVVPALRDETSMVRGAAYRAFRNLTRQSLPFRPDADSETRARQVKAIEAWWAGNRPGLETGKGIGDK